MSKKNKESLFRSLGSIRRSRNIIKEERDPNRLSIEIVLTQISNNNLLRMNLRRKNP
jgi:hypothetical protein